MNEQEIKDGIAKLAPFYHTIALPSDEGPVIKTPGEPYDAVWDNIREARKHLDYVGRNVLDLGTFDGMWAFEAETLGGKQVIAVDCLWRENVFFCARALKSKVIILPNVPMHEIYRRLDAYWGRDPQWTHWGNRPFLHDGKFDIVQHLGIFYHLRDPLFSLLQARSVIKDGGMLLLETAYWRDSCEAPAMLFNDYSSGGYNIYNDPTTWWAPNLSCIDQVLEKSGFERTEQVSILDTGKIGRACVCAEAVPFKDVDLRIMAELCNRWRTPGLE